MKASNPQFKLRLEPAVMEWLRRAAAEHCRSMNGEINYRLKAAMAAEQTSRSASAGGAPAAGGASRA